MKLYKNIDGFWSDFIRRFIIGGPRADVHGSHRHRHRCKMDWVLETGYHRYMRGDLLTVSSLMLFDIWCVLFFTGCLRVKWFLIFYIFFLYCVQFKQQQLPTQRAEMKKKTLYECRCMNLCALSIGTWNKSDSISVMRLSHGYKSTQALMFFSFRFA